jgi:quercetin dioxygenase-like cupin family protein
MEFVIFSRSRSGRLYSDMNIDTTLKLLGEVDVEPLKQAILALDEPAWFDNVDRQNDYEVHDQTRSVVLIFCDGTIEDLVVSKKEGWDHLADIALPIMQDVISRHYPAGGVIIRAMAANLVAGGRIKPHFDSHPSFRRSHRIHLPITTNGRVRFMIDGKPHRLQVGQAYEINNQKTHSVMNSGDEDRITFIFDYMPPEEIGRQSLGS